ncbi:MAG TPA: ABC transporter ATP-binding protein [Dongiaceae bacterium]|nr:ABC transporter ATP-binding protein [Dongiaceae bacterium]
MTDLASYRDRPFVFFLGYMRRRAGMHAGLFLAVVAAAACQVSTQYGIKFLVDTLALGHQAGDRIWLAFAFLIAMIAGDNLLWRLAGQFASRVIVLVTGDLRQDLFRYVTGHAPSYFADRLPGTLASRITAAANAVFTMENMFAWNLVPPVMVIAGAILYLSRISLGMTAGLVAAAGLMVLVLFRLAAAGKPLHRHFANKAAAVDGEMVDVLGNMGLVRAFGGIRRELQRLGETIGHELGARRRSLLYLERLRLAHAGVTILLTLGLLSWAIRLWQQGEASAGDVVMVATLGFTILQTTRDLAVALVDVTQHLARLHEAMGVLLLPHEIKDQPGAVALEAAGGAVDFEHIAFRYPGRGPTFENFDLKLAAGQRVGLVGESGAGKTTLLALLQRFYDVDGGRILIDGQDIAMVTQESLRQAIAVVPQDISLFHRSVLENIRYGRPEASDQEVWEAVEAARCADFIRALPQGIDTIVGERGVKLSGGQRQRVAIARALLKNAPILLLDEATSALDTESEEAIRAALDRLMQGRTVIAIAHRLSTLRNFDRIVVMQTGRVMEDGPPDQLLRADGPYRKLIRREMSRLSAAA